MDAEISFRSEVRLSQEEFADWLERQPASDINHYELIHGRIVMTPPTSWPHGRIGANLVYLISDHVRRHDLGLVMDASTGYEFSSGDTVEPDVSFLSKERLTKGPAPETGKFLRLVPDLIVEILSPSTARRDRTEKKSIYAHNGVGEYWLVDSKRRVVTVFRSRDGSFDTGTLYADGEVVSEAVAGLSVAVAVIFAD